MKIKLGHKPIIFSVFTLCMTNKAGAKYSSGKFSSGKILVPLNEAYGSPAKMKEMFCKQIDDMVKVYYKNLKAYNPGRQK